MPKDSYAAIPPNSTGPQVRTLQMQTFVDGVPLIVDVEGVVLVGADGRMVFKPGDSTELLSAILAEVTNIKQALWALTGNVDAAQTPG